MPLNWEQTKSLLRIQGLITEMLAGLDNRRNNAPQRAAGRALEAVIEEILGILDASEPETADEFRRLRDGLGSGFASVQARGGAILGWLKNAVEAETLERRIAEDARAYGDARLRAERQVGFAAPDGEHDE